MTEIESLQNRIAELERINLIAIHLMTDKQLEKLKKLLDKEKDDNVYGMINGKIFKNPTDKQLEDPRLMLCRPDGTPLDRAWHRRTKESKHSKSSGSFYVMDIDGDGDNDIF